MNDRRGMMDLGFSGDTLPAEQITARKLPAIPAAVAAYVKAKHTPGPLSKTVLTLTALPLTIADTGAFGGVEILDFAEGVIKVDGCTFSLTPTTTSVLADTLNASATLTYGLGTATASHAGTNMVTTEIDLCPGTGQTAPTAAASATINEAGTAAKSYLKAAAYFDGTSTAKKMYLNVSVGTDTDIDADATITISGTITIFHQWQGDY